MDGADVLRSPDLAVPKLEISWASGRLIHTAPGNINQQILVSAMHCMQFIAVWC